MIEFISSGWSPSKNEPKTSQFSKKFWTKNFKVWTNCGFIYFELDLGFFRNNWKKRLTRNLTQIEFWIQFSQNFRKIFTLEGHKKESKASHVKLWSYSLRSKKSSFLAGIDFLTLLIQEIDDLAGSEKSTFDLRQSNFLRNPRIQLLSRIPKKSRNKNRFDYGGH